MAETVHEGHVQRVGIARHPISPILLPVPIVCFVGALITDLAYDSSGGNLQWVNFSSWLLAAAAAEIGAAAKGRAAAPSRVLRSISIMPPA